MKKTWLIISIVVIIFIVWIAFNFKNTNNKTFKVGVSQYMTHSALDAVRTGVVAGFKNAGYTDGKNIIFDFQNAQGDNATNVAIAQKFANSDYDMIIPLGTQSAQAVANLIKDRPIIFGAITDPVSAGLVKSKEITNSNLTGTSNITLYKENLELLRKLAPSAKKIGLVYNPGEANGRYGIEQFKKYGEPMGFEFVLAVANNSSEVLGATKSIINKVDAFCLTPDNTVIAAQDSLIKVTIEGKKPLIAINQAAVEKGALATFGTNFEKVGERTAEIAVRVLRGEKISNIHVLDVKDADLFISTTTAQKIGINLSQDIISQAKKVY